VEEGFKGLPEAGVNMWYLLHYNLEDAYLSVKKGDFKNMGGYVIHVSPDKKTVFIFINAPFRNQKYWRENKMKLLDYFIHKIELNAIPELSKHTIFKEAATPSTLFRYTLNYKGAAFGWASLPTQLAEPDFKKPSFIKKLYLTGHWTTHGLGIPGVAYLGFDTAHLILKQEKLWHKAKQL